MFAGNSVNEISFYVDTLLVETILQDPFLYKKASFIPDLLERVKGYFSSKVDPNNPTASILNELAPGALWILFRSLGIGKWGLLLGLMMEVFHVDVYGMLTSLYQKVKSMVSEGQKVSSSQIDEAVQSVVEESSNNDSKVSSPEEMQEDMKNLNISSTDLMKDARIIRLALIEYENQKLRLTKQSINLGGFFGGYKATRSKGASLLGKIFGWVFKIALYSAGLMVAGDAINALIGRPNSFDKTYQAGKTTDSISNTPNTSNQTKYPPINDVTLPSAVNMVNSPANIENMVLQFAKDIYPSLNGKESLIRNTPGFKSVVNDIAWANQYNPGSQSIMIPPIFNSKKQMVDSFVNQVAQLDKK